MNNLDKILNFILMQRYQIEKFKALAHDVCLYGGLPAVHRITAVRQFEHGLQVALDLHVNNLKQNVFILNNYSLFITSNITKCICY